ncbi:MAG TPA: hypothetical protein PKC09_00045 [Paracoccus sp. (in: a-proteobacteria)]|uniref:hypothetical protein n=1 Tax=uncultured Paracoccus sp. TaxID=189685 RepID=UPI00262DC784|nr:hypothetical protein [uncultured Paracoccus sp.]HMQ39634.1 hypothetical protein [Paracoccus sp. (in: a-proteobacteria)]HMR36785.1 hypothetical protein [Paracoccus sp. (in: a-proteobacteria)]
MSDFENLGLKAGTWSGLLHRAAAPAQAGLVHNGERVAEARIAAAGEGIWRIDVDLPAERLGDGVTSFLLFEEVAGDEAPVGRGQPLASLSVSAGRALQRDLLAELDLVRAELELLKREFRRFGRG